MRLTMMFTLLIALALAACSAPFEQQNALTGALPDTGAPADDATPSGDAPSSDAGRADAASPDAQTDGQSPHDDAASSIDTRTDTTRPCPFEAGACGVVELASKQVVPSGLAVGDGTVFWTTEGASPDYVGNVFALSLSDPTATPSVIATNQKYPRALTFADGALYWGSYGDGAIGKWTATGGAVDAGIVPSGRPYNVVADSTHIYFALEIAHADNNPSTGAVARCPLSGCRGAPEILATADAKIVGIAIDGRALFWSVFSGSIGAIHRLTLDGSSSPRALAVGLASPLNVAAFGGFVYWVSPASGTVARVSAEAIEATPTILASNQASPWGIAADAQAVYWTTNTPMGQVMKLAHGTSSPIVLASEQPSPGHVRIDADFAYWTNKGDKGDGSIRRVPK